MPQCPHCDHELSFAGKPSASTSEEFLHCNYCGAGFRSYRVSGWITKLELIAEPKTLLQED